MRFVQIATMALCQLFLICCMFAAEETIPQQLLDWQKAAAEFQKSNDFSSALAEYEKIIQAYPATSYALRAHQETAIIGIKTKKLNEAQERIELIKKDFPTSPDIASCLYNIARQYGWSGLSAAAIKLHQYNVATYKPQTRALWSQVEIISYYVQHNDWDGAQQNYDRMLSIFNSEPTLPKEVWEVSRLYAKAGLNDRALELCRYGAERFPNTEYGAVAQGEIVVNCLQTNDFAGAKTQYDTLLSRFDQDPMLCREIYRIAGVYGVNGDAEKSLEIYRYNAQKYPDKEFGRWSYVEVVKALIRKKDFAAAQDAASAFAARYAEEPTLAKELYLFGREFAKAGDREKGFQQHLNNVLNAKEANEKRWSNVEIIFFYIDKNEYEKAASACIEFTKRYMNHADFGMEIRNIVNRCASNGNLSQGEALCNAILEAYPGQEKMIWVHGGLMQVYLEKMSDLEIDAAYSMLLNTYAANPDLAQVVKNLGQYCSKRNDFGKSLDLYARFLSTCVDHPNASVIEVEQVNTYIDMKAEAQTTIAVRNVLAKYSDLSQVDSLNNLANRCREAGLCQIGLELYQRALALNPSMQQQCDTLAGIAKAEIRASDRIEDPNYLKAIANNIPDVNDIVTQLLTTYKNQKNTGFHIFQIGEEYFFLLEDDLRKGDLKAAKDNVQRALAIWEISRNTLDDTLHQAHAAYYSAVACGYVGEYEKAMDFYNEVLLRWPTYDRAWHAQYMIVDCALNLVQTGKMQSAEMELLRRTAYSKLLEKYPTCPVSAVVRKALNASETK